MDDYIKRREAVIAFGNYLGATSKRASFAVECILKPVPAADVRENVRGKWVYNEKHNNFFCSICHCDEYGRSYEDGTVSFNNFCTNCGAYNGGEKNGLET